MNKLVAVAKLTRIEHSIMLIFAVIAAELLAGGLPAAPVFVLSLLTPALVSMGAFAINDYYDVGADRLNKKVARPLVSGALTMREAYGVAIFCLAAGTAISAFINPYAFVIAIIFAVLSYLYSYRLKDIVFVGNAYVAFAMVIPFIYGDYVVSTALIVPVIAISFVVFLSGLAREIHGTIRDRLGDRKARQSKNIAHYLEVGKASTMALILYLEAIAISIFMFAYVYPFALNAVYAILITISNLLLLYVAIGYKMKPTKRFFGLSRNLSLAGMGLAITAFLLSAVFYVYI